MTAPERPLTFEELLEMHARGLGLSDVLVLAFLRRNGRLAAEEIALACRLSERSVYRALRRLRQRGLAGRAIGASGTAAEPSR